MTIEERLKLLIEGLPAKPGCYLMKDGDGRIIYVGKAVNLRNRIRSYFHASASHSPKVAELVTHIEDIEWIVVGSELEALILEMTLIKRHHPKYNVHLKDDKRYPYIKITWDADFPKVFVTRRVGRDKARYYGPYTSVWAVHQTLDVLRKVFPYLTCDRVITGEDKRACLYYHIKLCMAPCIGVVGRETYRAMIKDLCRFLEGRSEPVVERMREEMAHASETMDYEHAAMIRDQLYAIEKVIEGQKVVLRDRIDSDVIAFARDEGDACVQVFFVRAGKLIGSEYFILDGTRQADDREVVTAFVKQFYAEATHVPKNVLLPAEVQESEIIESWLAQRRGEGDRVRLAVPRRGPKRALVKLAAENAAETLAMLRSRWEADRSKHVQALGELREALKLDEPPNRIECYDVSNLQGTSAAGSMVVFEQGTPSKRLYRKFTINSVDGQDDFASMEEILQRRFRRWHVAREKAAEPGGKLDAAFGMLPNLLIVDGGKGQLGRALTVLREHDLEGKIPVAGLAKSNEELYLPGERDPVLLPRRSQALYLVQRVRDEAHRFALSHHKTRRRRAGLASQLDEIEGIGPAKRKALIKAFGDVKSIREADVEAIAALPGISLKLAKRVKAEL
jgi:excinuclease ABC subunit C